MASTRKTRDVDDDIIMTLSDNDSGLDIRSDDEDLPSAQQNGAKKRKRVPEAINGSKKKYKKQKKNTKDERGAEGPIEADTDYDWAAEGVDDGAMDSDFEFQIGDVDTGVTEDFDGWGLSKGREEENGTKGGNLKGVDIDEIIARRRRKNKKVDGDDEEDPDDVEVDDTFAGFEEDDELLAEDGFGMGAAGDDDDSDVTDGNEEAGGSDDEDIEDGDASDDDSVASPVAHPDDFASDASFEVDDREDPVEAERRAAFFAPEEKLDIHKEQITKTAGSFQSMSLSRPILKGLAAVGFTAPTPIQAKTIPVALLGKDVVGGAVTGSGKTGAFIIPILERLLYRPKKIATTRVVILMPTRELAVQCFNVAKKLASFTDITFAQIVGGFSLREQEQVLKSRPDVVIATPGRFIDHMRNSASFAVETLEILVLDEADRMLEDGFADELNEILTTIPKSRQTMLFSATMTDSVDKLIRAGLNRPVRLMVDAKKQTVSGLVQEFVRIRPGKEDKKLAYLMYLCEHVYTERVIVFFRQKKEAHRVRIIFGLCGLKAAELHGSMSQEQRIQSVESFRSGAANYLLATDLASRGLDIKGVSTVLNYGAPQTHEIYLHRVGRTARAGRTGRSCTIASEPDRKVVKAAVKAARAQGAKIVSRIPPSEDIDAWQKKLESFDEEIDDILKEEKEEKALSQAEREVKRGENIVTHETEIMSRPRRTWFESEKEKQKAKDAGRVELNGPNVLGTKLKKKLSGKDKKKLAMKDERAEGRPWKKGSAERAGKGFIAKMKSGARGKSSKKTAGKADGNAKGKHR
ncbi:DEAD-domain-containing protein [Patellaria atrata CBS 101060]|uniref:RNA helicase n=1 Tax=Patellaria atrata CBS 101060 TaxID=1346257 RepID=A0A9P4SJW8_9PEZI|nr:DEAD-domain-containing protein [Patellaria atrata CBS 101060]